VPGPGNTKRAGGVRLGSEESPGRHDGASHPALPGEMGIPHWPFAARATHKSASGQNRLGKSINMA